MSDTRITGTAPEYRTYPKALRIVAVIISYVFHPVLMPVLMTLALFRLSPASFAGLSAKGHVALLLPIIVNTLIFPILGVLLSKAVGFIESIHMHNPKDRIIPLLISMIFYFWAFHVFRNTKDFQVPLMLLTLLLGSFWGVIAIFMVNIFFKVSMHTTAIGGVIGLLLILMFKSPVNMAVPFFLALFIAGLTGTARLIAGSHRGAEIWMGYFLGIIVQLSAYWYLS